MAKIKKFDMKDRKMQSFDALPKDDYPAVIEASEWKDTSSGGEMLVFKFNITKGQYKGRKHFENLNLVNDNKDTVRIAEGVLADINRACGFGEKLVKDSDKYNGVPIVITLGVRKTEKYGEQNFLAAVKPKGAKGKGSDKGSDDSKPIWEQEDGSEKKGKKGKKEKGKKGKK